MEVYVDNFILLLQTKSLTVLRDKTRNLLQAIYNTFSKQEINQQSNPLSVKKLEEEGVWETRKEILGWLFDGVRQTIKLKEDKRHKIIKLLQESRKLPTLTLNKLEKLHGKLQFFSIALPVGRPLLGELDVILPELQNLASQWLGAPNQANVLTELRGLVDLVEGGVKNTLPGKETNTMQACLFYS